VDFRAVEAGEPRQLHLFNDEPAVAVRAPRAPVAGGGERLRRRLNALLDGSLRTLVLTANRSRILTARPAAGRDPAGLDLRLDRCFTDAPDGVLREVAAFCRATSGRRGAETRRRALAAIREHFEARRAPARLPGPQRRADFAPRGARFDLAAIRDRLNRSWFGGRLTAEVTWGRERRGRGHPRALSRCRQRRASIQLGSYNQEEDLIRVHPALDRGEVPEYVVESVVFHELLHAALPPDVHNGRRRLHSAEFRRRERLHPDHARAERWIRANLPKLLKS